MDWAKTTARRDETHLSFGIRCPLYLRFYGILWDYCKQFDGILIRKPLQSSIFLMKLPSKCRSPIACWLRYSHNAAACGILIQVPSKYSSLVACWYRCHQHEATFWHVDTSKITMQQLCGMLIQVLSQCNSLEACCHKCHYHATAFWHVDTILLIQVPSQCRGLLTYWYKYHQHTATFWHVGAGTITIQQPCGMLIQLPSQCSNIEWCWYKCHHNAAHLRHVDTSAHHDAAALRHIDTSAISMKQPFVMLIQAQSQCSNLLLCRYRYNHNAATLRHVDTSAITMQQPWGMLIQVPSWCSSLEACWYKCHHDAAALRHADTSVMMQQPWGMLIQVPSWCSSLEACWYKCHDAAALRHVDTSAIMMQQAWGMLIQVPSWCSSLEACWYKCHHDAAALWTVEVVSQCKMKPLVSWWRYQLIWYSYFMLIWIQPQCRSRVTRAGASTTRVLVLPKMINMNILKTLYSSTTRVLIFQYSYSYVEYSPQPCLWHVIKTWYHYNALCHVDTGDNTMQQPFGLWCKIVFNFLLWNKRIFAYLKKKSNLSVFWEISNIICSIEDW